MKNNMPSKRTFFLWFPFILSLGAWIMFALFFGILWLISNYDQSVNSTVHYAWYQYPWGWPGDKMDNIIDNGTGFSPHSGIGVELAMLPRIVTSLIINIIIAILPILIFRFILLLWKKFKNKD